MWLWLYYNNIPVYPIFYLLKGDYKSSGLGFRIRVQDFGFRI